MKFFAHPTFRFKVNLERWFIMTKVVNWMNLVQKSISSKEIVLLIKLVFLQLAVT